MNALTLALAVALPPLMPVSEIAHGQQGACYTVFEGEAIEPFPFVVKGVMRNYLGPGRDLVLVRLQGDKAEFTGVVAGMSGSPCHIEGKLVGALAYAFATFAKEPIAGITPMQGMLDVMKLPAEDRPWRLVPSPSSGSTTRLGPRHSPWDDSQAADWDALRRGEPSPLARAGGDVMAEQMRPIATPLHMSGVVPEVREHFGPWLRSVGFEPVAGGSAAPGEVSGRLQPGSAVAAVLVRGDVDIAATGTVTSVEGDEVLAFGHPFFGAGAISVPMASARIINTMVSQMRSFKMSIVGPTIGEVTQDRLTAIGGFLGREPKMIPVDGSIETPVGKRTFRFEVARDLMLSPRFVAVGMANALSGRVDAGERGTVRLVGTVNAKGFDPVTVRNVYAAQRDGNLLINAAVDMARAMSTLWSTPFGPPPDIEIGLAAELEPEPIAEWIEAVHLDRAAARPGDPLEVAVRLQRDDGPPAIERFHIQVPRSWAGRSVDIVAAGASEVEQVVLATQGRPRPTQLHRIVAWLRSRRVDGNVFLLAVHPGAGMRANVEPMNHLPPSVVAVMSGEPSHRSAASGLAWEERRGRPGVVTGLVQTPLKVSSY